jgi:CopG family nickel-responsive transcriptional regulator
VADYERISITIEPELLQALDARIASRGHGNRSEAIRDLIRARLVQATSPDEVVCASLTLVYDHRQRALSERLVELAHDHHEIVLSTLHVHLDADRCMELSALRGPRGELEHYAEHLLGLKGVSHGELALVGAPGGASP